MTKTEAIKPLAVISITCKGCGHTQKFLTTAEEAIMAEAQFADLHPRLIFTVIDGEGVTRDFVMDATDVRLVVVSRLTPAEQVAQERSIRSVQTLARAKNSPIPSPIPSMKSPFRSTMEGLKR